MDKKEFNSKIGNEFSIPEMVMINPVIYYNPVHIKYYEKYHMGEYSWCLKYLRKHKHLLNLENCPEDQKIYVEDLMKRLNAIK